MNQPKSNAPDHRSGFRYRRAVGESLVRETRAFERELGGMTRLSHVRVTFLSRDGRALVMEAPLVDAMHAIQFNDPIIDGHDASDAFAVDVFTVD